ncbi:MAG: homoserine dehydrogenase [Alphaproteobacteria bacterium]|nr:homoserine dehydrogenase [Alphaproteobacteria bacterium]
MKRIAIAIAGLGTVGSGVIHQLHRQRDLLKKQGLELDIVGVSARNREKAAQAFPFLDPLPWWENAAEMARACPCDVVVELVGGEEGIAKEIAEAALSTGKELISANKALLAKHFDALQKLSQANACAIRFEGAVAGGIPIIKALTEGLAINNVRRVEGILNGTCNYILTAMTSEGRAYQDVLEEAQALGYAEADPTTDVEGHDTAHKLALLARLLFGWNKPISKMSVKGIADIQAIDITVAQQLGYIIKLIGVGSMTNNRLDVEVAPMMIADTNPLAKVDGVLNAVHVTTEMAGTYTLIGPGAGAEPTASAVIADIIDAALSAPSRNFFPARQEAEDASEEDGHSRIKKWYLRLEVVDKPGVLAVVTALLRDNQISVDSVLQKGQSADDKVSLVMVTHPTRFSQVKELKNSLDRLDFVLRPTQLMPIIENE